MQKNTLIAIAVVSAIAVAVSMAACDRRSDVVQAAPQPYAPAPQPAQAAAPVIVNQPAAQSSGVGDMLMGGALGYMLGRSGSGGNGGGGNQGGTTVNRTVINKTVIVNRPPAATPAPTPITPAKPVAAAPTKPSYAQVYTPRPSAPAPSRPSYSAARSSSFGGRR